MLYYIEKYEFTEIYLNNSVHIYNRREKYLGLLCKKNLFDLKSYIKNVKKYTSLKSQIPIFINEKILLFKLVLETEIIYLNFFEIINIGINKESIYVLFKNGKYLEIYNNNQKINKNLNKCKEIINYKKSIFELI